MFTTIPYQKEDFLWTEWKRKDIEEQAALAVESVRKGVDIICSVSPSARTFENTIYALDSIFADLYEVQAKIELLMNVSTDAEVRNAAQSAIDLLQGSSLELISYNERLYAACKEYASSAPVLDVPSKRLLDDYIRGYRRCGFDLSFGDREALKANNKELQLLCNQFQKNINEDQQYITVATSDVEGLSDNYLSGLKKTEAGDYIVTTAYPDYIPFVENAKNAAKRKELVDLFFTKGGDKNIELLSRMVKLRRQNAQLLGYATHADFVTEERMAKTAITVRDFLQGLINALRPGVAADLALLELTKRDDLGDESAKLEYFDVQYYINYILRAKFSVDSELVREYFPLDHVISQLFVIYGTLFSVTFEEVTNVPVWHEDVTVYAVKDFDGNLVSYFALDLHPREGKYGHAAEFPVVIGHKVAFGDDDDNYRAPFAVMVANFPKMSTERPSLMPHDQVEVLFHEFGHVMHENLARARYFSQSGTLVARDFVEAPSQMLENWVWDKQILRQLSKHYKTSSPLPDELIEKMLAAKSHMIGYLNMRQMVLALFDFKLHTEDHADDIVALYNGVVKDLLGVGLLPQHRWPAGFGHMAGGYDAGYYGYMWSKVYACDMFTRFKLEGVLSTEVGAEYRKKVLEVGSSRDEMDSVIDFLGRKPNNKAFLFEIGLGDDGSVS